MAKVVRKDKETLDSMMHRFKRKVLEEGIMDEIRRREYYESPSVRRKHKAQLAQRRRYDG